MIVENLGYLSLEDVLKIEKQFSIYETHKKTHILVKECVDENIVLYYPKEDRLPYKEIEGKKICSGTKIFDSKINSIEELDISKWNGGKQIMSYEYYYYYKTKQ